MSSNTVTIRGGLPGKNPVYPLDCTSAGTAILNGGPRTVYYRDEQPVSASLNDGSISAAGSATLTGVQFLALDSGQGSSSADTATLTITPNAAVAAGGGGPGTDPDALHITNNLSDVGSAAAARSNLGLGTASTLATSGVLQPSNNLSEVASAATSRSNLGLGTAAVLASSAVLQGANNLSDVGLAATARANLAATQNLTPTAVKAANYTAAPGDYVLCDTLTGGVAITVTLPIAPVNNTRVGVRFVTQGGARKVTIARAGSDLINGSATSMTLDLPGTSTVLQYQSTTAIWYEQSSALPLSQLDARFDATGSAATVGSTKLNVPSYAGAPATNLGPTSSILWDLLEEQVEVGTLDQNHTATYTTPVQGAQTRYDLTQDSTGGRTFTVTDGTTPTTLPVPTNANDQFTVIGVCNSTSVVRWTVFAKQSSGAQFKYVAADLTAITSSTTLANVTGLFVPIGSSASEAWLAEVFLVLSGANTAMDVKLGWTLPTGASGYYAGTTGANNTVGWGPGTTGQTPNALTALSASQAYGSAAATFGLAFTALIKGGGTAGNVQLQLAQNTSDAGALQVLTGSFLRYWQMHT